MPESPELQTSRTSLGALFEDWDKRAASYGAVLYGTALVRGEDGWRSVLTYLLPLRPEDGSVSARVADYGNFLLATGSLTLAQAKGTLHRVVETAELSLPGLPPVRYPGRLLPYRCRQFRPSHYQAFPLLYPYFEYTLDSPDHPSVSLPQGQLCLIDLPLYPSGKAAMDDILSVVSDRVGLGQLIALVPDYRARIAQLRLSTNGVQVEIDCSGTCTEENLLVKVYQRAAMGQASHGELPVHDKGAHFPAEDFPQNVIVALFDRRTGDLLDQRYFCEAFPDMSGAVIETPRPDVVNLVQAGESEYTEFKGELPRGEDFAIPVIAFANRRGGQIVIGVDARCNFVGFKPRARERIRDTIANLIRHHCEACPEFSLQEIVLEEKLILVVSVSEGKDKPYALRSGGVYIRSGASNRLATRHEIDGMYAQRAADTPADIYG